MIEEHHLFFGWVLLMLMMTIGVTQTQVPEGELYIKELVEGRSIVWKKATEGTTRSEEECTVRLAQYKTFFNNFLEDMSPFCGATDTPILDFW